MEHGADINAKNSNDKTALVIASEKGNLGIVKYLLEHGADNINYALRMASKRGYSEIVNCLLKNGSGYINEALLDAIINENLELVKYLVEHGADVNIEDYQCNTALDFTTNEEIIKILKEAGAM